MNISRSNFFYISYRKYFFTILAFMNECPQRNLSLLLALSNNWMTCASVLELLKRELNYQLSYTMCSGWLLLLFLDILAWLHTLHHTKYLYMKLIRVLRFCFKGVVTWKSLLAKKYSSKLNWFWFAENCKFYSYFFI